MTNKEYEAKRNALIEPAYKRACRNVMPSKKGQFAREFMKQMTEAAVAEGLCRAENMALFLMPVVNGIPSEEK